MDNHSWTLPNPFIGENGQMVGSPDEWNRQRDYLRKILEEDFYGKAPVFSGRVTSERLFSKKIWDDKGLFEVHLATFGDVNPFSFRIAAIYPAEDRKSIPIILNGGYVDERLAKLAIDHGFSVFTYDFEDAAPDSWAYRDAAIAERYHGYDWKLIRIWGWMQSRVIDWLETMDVADASKPVVAGHSRYGKTALCCGVFEPRAAVCVAAGSGCGGFGSLRRAGGRFGEDTGYVETLGWMMKEGNLDHWFKDGLKDYGSPELNGHSRENELRFDANFIGSAIAPTPLLILEGLDDNWSNPYGTQLTWNAVAEVYAYLGMEDRCGLHFREGGHEFNLEDWTIMIDFCSHILLGTEKTTTYKTYRDVDIRVGHDWKRPGNEDKPDVTYADISKAQLLDYLEMEEDRWCFDEAGFGRSMREMIR